jgi:hypothetical protein
MPAGFTATLYAENYDTACHFRLPWGGHRSSTNLADGNAALARDTG